MRLERSPRFRLSFVVFLAAIATLSSCTEPKFDATPATITVSGNPATTGTVGVPLPTPLTVVIKNAGGEPIPQASVSFAVTGGGGTLSLATVLTDTTGKASTNWTLGPTAGTQTVSATVTGLAPVTFTVTASAGAASVMTKNAGDTQTATAGANVGTAPAVKVADQFGNAVSGVLVTFAVASGGGAVTGASANSGADGIARVGSWRLGNSVGSNSLTASAPGLANVTFTATGTVGAAARVQITNTAPVMLVGQTFQLNSRVFDANNNEISGAPVTYTTSNTAVATVNASNGTITAVGPGNATITAAASTGVNATQLITVIGHPSGVLVGTVAGQVKGLAVVGNTAYEARPSDVAIIDLPGASTSGTIIFVDPPVDVAASRNGTGPIVVPTVVAGGTSYLRLINPSTRLQIDSVALNATPVRAAMNAAATRAFVAQNSFNLAVIDVTNRTLLTETPTPGTVVAMKMSPTDSLLYVATRNGAIFEIRASTGAIRRQIQGPAGLLDIDISPDGRTLFLSDGSAIVTYVPIFTGGLSGSADFGANVTGVAMTPDALELWASVAGAVIAAPLQNGEFNTGLADKRYVLTGSSPTRIVFNQSGSFAAIIDGANQLIIRR
jgi:hypothetical protein